MKRFTAALLAFALTGALVQSPVLYAAEQRTEQATEQPTEDIAGQATGQMTKRMTVQSAEDTTGQTTEQAAEGTTGQTTEHTTEQPTEQPTEHATEHTTEQPTEHTTEHTTEQPTEHTTEHATEQPTGHTTEQPTEDTTEKKDDLDYKLSSEELVLNIYDLKADADGYFDPEKNSITIENVSEDTDVNWVSSSKKLLVGREGDDTFYFFPKKKGNYTVDFHIGQKVLTCKVEVINAYIAFKRNDKSLNDEIGSKWIKDNTTLCLYPKEKTTLKLEKSGVSDASLIKWSSSDKNIAKVSKSGVVTAKNYGYADITVTYKEVVKATYRMAVTYKTAAKALRYAAKNYHSTYSQPKRMWTHYFDCSSYVWRSYKAVGKKIGDPSYTSYAPTAAELARWTTEKGLNIIDGKMDPSKMLPGDILFETGAKNGRFRGIYHIDFYTGYGRRMTVARSKDYIEPGTVIVARPCMGTPATPSVKAKEDYVYVSWKPYKSFGADGYYVYRKTGDGAYKKVKTVKKKNNYKDKSVSSGKKYTYKIKPYWKTNKTFHPKYSGESKSVTAK